VLGTSPSSRAIACTPIGASLRPSRRRMAAARAIAGALLVGLSVIQYIE
jgi:hypothetical protein